MRANIETRALAALLERARRGEGGALVARGGAGVGKTTLLDWAVEQAHGFRALEASGAEFEMELAFAGLHVLCGPLLGGCDRLPEPQREALEAAFGFRTGSAPDPLRAGMAVLTLLSDAGEDAPVICVVDDAHWLDRASAQALAFAARRIGSEPVAMLFGVRDPDVPSELGAIPPCASRAFPTASRASCSSPCCAPPSTSGWSTGSSLRRAGTRSPCASLAAVGTPGELVGGFAVSGAGRGDGGELFRPRLEALPPDTRLLLLLAAAEPLGDPVLLWGAAERLGLGPAAAEPAETSGLLEIDDYIWVANYGDGTVSIISAAA